MIPLVDKHMALVLQTGSRGREGPSLLGGFLADLSQWYSSSPVLASSSHFALLTDAASASDPAIGLSRNGDWHCLASTSAWRHARGTPSGLPNVTFDLAPLERIMKQTSDVAAPWTSEGDEDPEQCVCFSVQLANQIHSLLDRAPWKPNEYVIFDVYWLVSDSAHFMPSAAIELCGVLLRAIRWCGACLKVVTSPGHAPLLPDWLVSLKTLPICSLSSALVVPGIIWRGSLHFTESKAPKQAYHRTLAFAGFALSLTPLPLLNKTPDSPSSSPSLPSHHLLEGVGLARQLSHSYSHLEVVTAIDIASFPLLWLSPLRATLVFENRFHDDSKALFSALFGSRAGKSLGIIVRLCVRGAGERGGGVAGGGVAGRCTTAEWMEFVQSGEDASILEASPISPLDSYLPGPLLLVVPADQSDTTTCLCDAWFLWKSDSLNGKVFSQLRSWPMESGGKSEDEAVPSLLDLQLPGPPTASHSPTTTDLVECFWEKLSHFTHEVDTPSHDWLEVKALQTKEWIERKMIRRLTTPDMMFGLEVAPSLSSSSVTVETSDVSTLLNCFKETGSPVAGNLSPIAMCNSSSLVKIHDPAAGNVSFGAVTADTPRSRRSYHGVSYCFTADDMSQDSRMTRVQQRCLTSERACNCRTANSPQAQHRRNRNRKPPTSARDKPAGAPESGKESTEKKASLSLRDGSVGGSAGPRLRSSATRQIDPRKSPVINLKRLGGAPGRAKERNGLEEERRENAGSLAVERPLRRRRGGKSARKLTYGWDSREGQSMATGAGKEDCPPSGHAHHGADSNSNSPSGHAHHGGDSHSSLGKESKHLACCISKATVPSRSSTASNENDTGAALNSLPSPSLPPALGPSEEAEGVCGRGGRGGALGVRGGALGGRGVELRRSPRKNKWRIGAEGRRGGGRGVPEERDSSREKRSARHNRRLEQTVVSSLKHRGVSRSHTCFRSCYKRLFTLSKSFLKDLTTSRGLAEEMKRVVEANVEQVVEFEQRRVKTV